MTSQRRRCASFSVSRPIQCGLQHTGVVGYLQVSNKIQHEAGAQSCGFAPVQNTNTCRPIGSLMPSWAIKHMKSSGRPWVFNCRRWSRSMSRSLEHRIRPKFNRVTSCARHLTVSSATTLHRSLAGPCTHPAALPGVLSLYCVTFWLVIRHVEPGNLVRSSAPLSLMKFCVHMYLDNF